MRHLGSLLCVPKGHPPLPLSPSAAHTITPTDRGSLPPPRISPCATPGRRKTQTQAVAICGRGTAPAEAACRAAVCGRTLAFSGGTVFLEAVIDAHLRSSVLSVLARLRPRSCHKVDVDVAGAEALSRAPHRAKWLFCILPQFPDRGQPACTPQITP